MKWTQKSSTCWRLIHRRPQRHWRGSQWKNYGRTVCRRQCLRPSRIFYRSYSSVLYSNSSVLSLGLVSMCSFNSLPTYECRLLITFANSLGPDQARQNVGSDLDSNCLTLWWYSWKKFSKKLFCKEISRQQKSMKNLPVGKELTLQLLILTKCRLLCIICWFFQNVSVASRGAVWSGSTLVACILK